MSVLERWASWFGTWLGRSGARGGQTGPRPGEKGQGTSARGEKTQGWEPVRLRITGLGYENRSRHVRKLTIGKRVCLVRDPRNKHDANAIAVRTLAGRDLGFVARTQAAFLAGHMDRNDEKGLHAIVTELAYLGSEKHLGLSVSVDLPSQVAAELEEAPQEWDATFDPGPGGSGYLYLNCNEVELSRVRRELVRNGVSLPRSGYTYQPASNGRTYRWYVTLDQVPSETALGQILNETLGAHRRRLDVVGWLDAVEAENERLRGEAAVTDELLNLSSTENQELVKKNKGLASENEKLRRENERVSRHSDKLMGEVSSLYKEMAGYIETVCRLSLLDKSLEIIREELVAPHRVLEKLRDICWAPEKIKARRVQSTGDWLELHFSTGRKDDGRLYYRKKEDRWEALVSLKNSQGRDIEYLRNL